MVKTTITIININVSEVNVGMSTSIVLQDTLPKPTQWEITESIVSTIWNIKSRHKVYKDIFFLYIKKPDIQITSNNAKVLFRVSRLTSALIKFFFFSFSLFAGTVGDPFPS